MTSPRALVLALVAALAGTGATLALVGPAQAQSEEVEVVCTQIPQDGGRMSETFVAKFMREQLLEGRQRFQAVEGITTVLCAY